MEDYSSGCESGWTGYFEQSRGFVEEGCVTRSEEEEEEEDLSMVSDASSGPAQVSQDEAKLYLVWDDEEAALGRSKQQQRRNRNPRRGEKRAEQEEEEEHLQSHVLDDTASSRPDFNYSAMQSNDQEASSMRQMMDFSQDHFSTSYFKGGASISSTAIQSHHYTQVQQLHQQYHWY